MSENQIPSSVVEDLSNLETSQDDIVEDLKGRLQISEDALADEKAKRADLENSIKLLRDNQPVKVSAVRAAKTFLFLVPIFCLAILAIANMSVSIPVDDDTARALVNIKLDLNQYSQAALIVSPIAFIGAVVGFLLKGAFSSKDDDGLASSLANLAALSRLLK